MFQSTKVIATKVIDPHGDVFIVHQPTLTAFKVSSKVLCLASTRLSGILACYPLRAGTPPAEIDLVEGSPEAYEIVFNILHLKNNLIRHNIPSDLLYQIAKVGNAFHLNEALGIWKDVWMSSQEVSGKKKLCLMLLFSNQKGFKEECMNLILSGEGESEDDTEKGWDWGVLQEVPGRYTFHPTISLQL